MIDECSFPENFSTLKCITKCNYWSFLYRKRRKKRNKNLTCLEVQVQYEQFLTILLSF